MTHIDNPPRLFQAHEAPAELRTWLLRAHDDVPSSTDIEQLARAVEQRMRAPAATCKAPWRSRFSRHSTKLFLAAAAMGLGLGAGTWYFGNDGNDGNDGNVGNVGNVGNDNIESLIPASGPPSGPAEEPSEQPPPVTQPATVSSEDPGPPRRPAPRAPTSASSRVRARASAQASVSPAPESTPPPPATNSADEYRLLRAAQQALANHPARALELTDEHKRHFPTGMLVQEREAIAVDALLNLSQEGVAKTRARTFLAAFPNSPYRARIERSLSHSTNTASHP